MALAAVKKLLASELAVAANEGVDAIRLTAQIREVERQARVLAADVGDVQARLQRQVHDRPHGLPHHLQLERAAAARRPAVAPAARVGRGNAGDVGAAAPWINPDPTPLLPLEGQDVGVGADEARVPQVAAFAHLARDGVGRAAPTAQAQDQGMILPSGPAPGDAGPDPPQQALHAPPLRAPPPCALRSLFPNERVGGRGSGRAAARPPADGRPGAQRCPHSRLSRSFALPSRIGRASFRNALQGNSARSRYPPCHSLSTRVERQAVAPPRGGTTPDRGVARLLPYRALARARARNRSGPPNQRRSSKSTSKSTSKSKTGHDPGGPHDLASYAAS